MHKFFATWFNSILAAFSGGHFHLTGGLVALGAVVIPVLLMLGRSAAREFGSPSGGETAGFFLVIGGLIAATVYLVDRKPGKPAKAAAAHHQAPPPPVVHKTTIVQHITNLPGHPIISGWQIVALVGAAAVIGLVMFLNLLRRSN